MHSSRPVVLIGAASGSLYAAIYTLQRSIAPVHAPAGPALWLVVALYAIATLVQFLLYAKLISLASAGALGHPRARMLALAFPVLFNVALLAGRPYLSIDSYTYVAHGHQMALGDNPYAQSVKDLEPTPYGAQLSRFGWIPVHGVSPYGPLWTGLEGAVGRMAPDVPAGVRLIKILVTLFSLGSAAMIWLILGRVAPRSQLPGTLLYLWNPVVLVEFAGEGHNDALMIFFMLLSLFLSIRAREGLSVVAASLVGLVKIIGVMIVPLELVYAWRTRSDRGKLAAGLLLGACAAAALAVIVFAPVWIGGATFDGLRAHGRPAILPSTPGVLYWYLTRTHSEEASARLLSLLMTGIFVASMALASLKVKDAIGLLKACGRVAVVYLIVAPGYWPWYATMPVALLALAPTATCTWAIVALSLASRLAAPIDALRLDGLTDWEGEVFSTTIVGIWLPAAAFLLLGAWRSRSMLKDWSAASRLWRSARPSYDQP